MTTVLVTGGAGQLASCIRDAQNNFKDLKFIYADRQALNICDYNQVEEYFKNNKIHYCINCAAYTAVDKAETEKEKALQVNAEGPKNLALACKKNSAVLIHISTDFVFNGDAKMPYTEKDDVDPINVYGYSKLQGEIEIQKILSRYFIVRTSWLYSEYGNNFTKTMLKLAYTRDEISVIDDQIGTPTYAANLAEVIVNIIGRKKTNFGIYHYSNLGQISWFDFAKEIFNLSNIDIKISPIVTEAFPSMAKRPKFSVLDKTKIQEKLDISIPNWRDSLEKCLKN